MPIGNGQLLAQLRTDTEALAALLAALGPADLDTAVPACPGWDLRRLVRHLARVHRWATEVVRTGEEAQTPRAPEADSELVPWAAEAAAELVGTLSRADPDRPCWTFGPEPHVTAFWFRRQAQETAIHRVDAHQALGLPPNLPTELALDGVDEVREMFFPRQVRLGRIPSLGERLDLVCADTGRRWTFAGDGTEAANATPVAATLTAPAVDLLLMLWHRAGPDSSGSSVVGDERAVARVLGVALTP